MKKISMLFLVVLMILMSLNCAKEGVKGIDKLLPQDSTFVLKFRGLDLLIKDFIPVLAPAVKQMPQLKAILGFNPFNEEELKKFGIDPAKEFGLVINQLAIEGDVLQGPPKFAMAIFIPLVEGKSLIAKLEEMLKKIAPGLEFKKEGGITLMPPMPNSPKIGLLEKGGYLFIAGGNKTEPATLLNSIGKDTLDNSAMYKKVVSQVKTNSSLFLYANFEKGKFFDQLFTVIKKQYGGKPGSFSGLDMFKGYRGMALSFDISGSDLVMETGALIAEDAQVMKLYKDIKYCKNAVLGVKKNPLLYLSFGFNIVEYLKFIKKSLGAEKASEMEIQFQKLKDDSGFDVNDIIANLGGNINLAIYGGDSISMQNSNMVMALSFKDEAKVKVLIEKLMTLIPAEVKDKLKKSTVEGVETYTIPSGMGSSPLLGIHKGNLIIASGEQLYKEALKGDVSAGFTSRMNKQLAVEFKEADVFYFSFDEALKAFNRLKPVLNTFLSTSEGESLPWVEKIVKVLEKVDYIMTANKKLKDKLFTGKFILKTRFKGSFISGIMNIVASFQKE